MFSTLCHWNTRKKISHRVLYEKVKLMVKNWTVSILNREIESVRDFWELNILGKLRKHGVHMPYDLENRYDKVSSVSCGSLWKPNIRRQMVIFSSVYTFFFTQYRIDSAMFIIFWPHEWDQENWKEKSAAFANFREKNVDSNEKTSAVNENIFGARMINVGKLVRVKMTRFVNKGLRQQFLWHDLFYSMYLNLWLENNGRFCMINDSRVSVIDDLLHRTSQDSSEIMLV